MHVQSFCIDYFNDSLAHPLKYVLLLCIQRADQTQTLIISTFYFRFEKEGTRGLLVHFSHNSIDKCMRATLPWCHCHFEMHCQFMLLKGGTTPRSKSTPYNK